MKSRPESSKERVIFIKEHPESSKERVIFIKEHPETSKERALLAMLAALLVDAPALS